MCPSIGSLLGSTPPRPLTLRHTTSRHNHTFQLVPLTSLLPILFFYSFFPPFSLTRKSLSTTPITHLEAQVSDSTTRSLSLDGCHSLVQPNIPILPWRSVASGFYALRVCTLLLLSWHLLLPTTSFLSADGASALRRSCSPPTKVVGIWLVAKYLTNEPIPHPIASLSLVPAGASARAGTRLQNPPPRTPPHDFALSRQSLPWPPRHH